MKNLLFLILVLVLVSCYQSERDCAKFKTGTFEFSYSIDGVEKVGRFMRNDTLNIDYFDNRVDSASVRWINDCEFILTKINPKNRQEEKPIHMKILATKENSYDFEYRLAIKESYQKQRVEKGTATKID